MRSEPTLRAGSRAPAWPAGNGSGLLRVEHRCETGSGPTRRVGAGGDGLWRAGGERVVVRGSVPHPALSSKPPEPEQGIPAALQHPTLRFLSSRGVGRCPCRVAEPREPQTGFPGPRGSPSSIPVPISATSSQRRLAPYLIFPLPIKKNKKQNRENDRYLCLARTRCGIPEGRNSGPAAGSSVTGEGGGAAAEQNRAGQPPLPLRSPATSLCHEDIY